MVNISFCLHKYDKNVLGKLTDFVKHVCNGGGSKGKKAKEI